MESHNISIATSHTHRHIAHTHPNTNRIIKHQHQQTPTIHTMALKTNNMWRLAQVVLALLGLVCATGILAATPASAVGASHSPNTGGRVLLSDVQTLTLHTGRMTTGRRSSPVPQAKAVGGTAQGQFVPSTIQCTNKGWDGLDAQWECRADLDNAFRFGETVVVCEGYDYPDDPYILAGSCGVEYTLELTQEGRDIRKAKASAGYGGYPTSSSYSSRSSTYNATEESAIWGAFTWICVFCVVVWACTGGDGHRHHHTTVHAPPAYTSHCGGGYGGGYSRSGSGFGTGFVAGSVLGSAFSRPSRSSYASSYSPSSYSSSSSSRSSGTRSASGYGGTRRR